MLGYAKSRIPSRPSKRRTKRSPFPFFDMSSREGKKGEK